MYLVLEIQKFPDGHLSEFDPIPYETLAEAESKWHEILSYAAKSTQPLHSCVVLAENGALVRTESYAHPQTVPIPEEETTPEEPTEETTPEE